MTPGGEVGVRLMADRVFLTGLAVAVAWCIQRDSG